MLTHEKMEDDFSYLGRPDILRGSAIHKNRLGRIVDSLDRNISIAVEIGTYRGISAAVLASLGIFVHTFDVIFQEDAEFVWKHFNCSEMIEYHVPPFCKKRKFHNIIKTLDFQFAFIDGQHTYEAVQSDFLMVKSCKLVLFHDNRDSFPGVKKLIQEIDARSIGEFALWEG